MKHEHFGARRRSPRFVLLLGLAALIAGLMAWAPPKAVSAPKEGKTGDRVRLGDGYLETYTQRSGDGTLTAMGLQFSSKALENLPTQPADGYNCVDVNGDKRITLESPTECVGGHQFVLSLPLGEDIGPFTWMLVNWNPNGHIPPGVYDVPHFDIHFYIMGYAERNMIRPGTCGPELADCDDFKTAMKPVPAQFVQADFKNVGAVVPKMGAHLIDMTGPELQPRPPKGNGRPFTHSFIYGAYDGRVTFWEVMLTLKTLRERPDVCTPIKLPAQYEVGGSYPTKYCIRYESSSDSVRVSLEDFQQRQAGFAYR